MKIIGKSLHEWPQNRYSRWRIYHFIFFTRHFMSWTYNSAKTNYRSLISPLSPGTVFSELALWRHHSWSVTTRERGVLALWRHIRRLFLRAKNGDVHLWIITVNFDFSPPSIHGLHVRKNGKAYKHAMATRGVKYPRLKCIQVVDVWTVPWHPRWHSTIWIIHGSGGMHNFPWHQIICEHWEKISMCIAVAGFNHGL